MKKIILLTAIILYAIPSSAQRYEWFSHSDQGGTNAVVPVAVDPNGNIYTLIHTSSEVIIQGDTIHTITGSAGVVITKFDPNGNFLWGSMVNADAGSVATGKLAVDNAGAAYATFYWGNGGQMHLTDTTFLPVSGAPALIIKLDSSGHFVHAVQFASSIFPITCLGSDIYIGEDYKIQKLASALNIVWTVSAAPGTVSFD